MGAGITDFGMVKLCTILLCIVERAWAMCCDEGKECRGICSLGGTCANYVCHGSEEAISACHVHPALSTWTEYQTENTKETGKYRQVVLSQRILSRVPKNATISWPKSKYADASTLPFLPLERALFETRSSRSKIERGVDVRWPFLIGDDGTFCHVLRSFQSLPRHPLDRKWKGFSRWWTWIFLLQQVVRCLACLHKVSRDAKLQSPSSGIRKNVHWYIVRPASHEVRTNQETLIEIDERLKTLLFSDKTYEYTKSSHASQERSQFCQNCGKRRYIQNRTRGQMKETTTPRVNEWSKLSISMCDQGFGGHASVYASVSLVKISGVVFRVQSGELIVWRWPHLQSSWEYCYSSCYISCYSITAIGSAPIVVLILDRSLLLSCFRWSSSRWRWSFLAGSEVLGPQASCAGLSTRANNKRQPQRARIAELSTI